MIQLDFREVVLTANVYRMMHLRSRHGSVVAHCGTGYGRVGSLPKTAIQSWDKNRQGTLSVAGQLRTDPEQCGCVFQSKN